MSYKIATNGMYFRDDDGNMIPSGAVIGVSGEDGYSPTATVTQNSDGVTITVTDKNGTTSGKMSPPAYDDTELRGLVSSEAARATAKEDTLSSSIDTVIADLSTKQDKLTAGESIEISNNKVSVDYSVKREYVRPEDRSWIDPGTGEIQNEIEIIPEQTVTTALYEGKYRALIEDGINWQDYGDYDDENTWVEAKVCNSVADITIGDKTYYNVEPIGYLVVSDSEMSSTVMFGNKSVVSSTMAFNDNGLDWAIVSRSHSGSGSESGTGLYVYTRTARENVSIRMVIKQATINKINHHGDTIYSRNTNGKGTAGWGNVTVGYGNCATGRGAGAIGWGCLSSGGGGSIAMGDRTSATSGGAFSSGWLTTASGQASNATGYNTTASGYVSHAEGNNTISSAAHSHAEGLSTESSGEASHCEGWLSKATGECAHAEGNYAEANGKWSHAEGKTVSAYGPASHVEGQYTSTTEYSGAGHAEGVGTVSNARAQHVEGQYNLKDESNIDSTHGANARKYLHIVGNGTADDARSNAYTLDWTGNGCFAGNVECGSLVMRAPDGSLWTISVDNNGILSSTKVVN